MSDAFVDTDVLIRYITGDDDTMSNTREVVGKVTMTWRSAAFRR